MAAPNSPLPSPPAGGDRNRGPSMLATETIFVAIGTFLVLARLYVRSHIIRNLGLDDPFIVLGLIFAIIVLALDGVVVHYGFGRHQFYLELSPQLSLNLTQAIKWVNLSAIAITFSTMFTKVSICFFLLRIFGTKWACKPVLYSIMALLVATSLSSVCLILVQCSPVRKIWEPLISGTCWSPDARLSIGEYNGAVGAFCDWALASLPIFFMWNLQMSIKLKAGICVLMGMGFFSGICVIVRTVLLRRLDATDFTWDGIPFVIWAFLEATVGIIAACIPTLKPLFDTSRRFPWSTRGRSRRLAGEELGQPHSEEDDTSRLRPAPQDNVHLDTLSASQDVYLRDDGRERNRVEINGGVRGKRSVEGMGLGREEIRMETEFGAYKSDVSDDFDRG